MNLQRFSQLLPKEEQAQELSAKAVSSHHAIAPTFSPLTSISAKHPTSLELTSLTAKDSGSESHQ